MTDTVTWQSSSVAAIPCIAGYTNPLRIASSDAWSWSACKISLAKHRVFVPRAKSLWVRGCHIPADEPEYPRMVRPRIVENTCSRREAATALRRNQNNWRCREGSVKGVLLRTLARALIFALAGTLSFKLVPNPHPSKNNVLSRLQPHLEA